MNNLLLANTSFKNQGDAMMNQVIMDKFGERKEFAITANLAFAERRRRGLMVCMVSDLPGANWKQRIFNASVKIASATVRLLGYPIRRRIRVLVADDISIAVDVSGYSYGDPWGQLKVDSAIRMYALLKSRGCRIVFMPKTWGPFFQVSASSVRRLVGLSDLCYARDKKSLSTLRDLLPQELRQRVSFAPDYTHGFLANGSEMEKDEFSGAYIVPSYRVIDSGVMTQDEYVKLLADAAHHIRLKGIEVKFLLHELSADRIFSIQLGSVGFGADSIVVSRDPWMAKRLLRGAALVVTSRLHAMYSCLNSGVPVVVIPWNFKYEEALALYECGDVLVDMDNPHVSLVSIIDRYKDSEFVDRISNAMARGRVKHELLSAEMWEEIIGLS